MDLQKRLYVKNYEAWKYFCNQECFSTEVLKVQEVPDGAILPMRAIPDNPCVDDIYEGGVVDAKGRFVAGSIRINKKNPGYMSVLRGYSVKSEELQHSPEKVIFGGVVIKHFGHFLVECMSRLWYVLQQRDDGKKIVFIDNGWKTDLKMNDFFELLGIDLKRIVFLKRPTRFASVIIPEESVHSWGQFYTQEYRQIYQKLRDAVPASSHKKIYLTHSAYHRDITCCNEQYFENYFAAKGFAVISPEKYSLAEQIAILKGADEVACMVSTLSHLILLAKPHTKLIMLTRTSHDVLVAQCLINEAAQADWYIVDASQNYLYGNRSHGVILLGATECWRNFVRDHYGEEDVPDTLSEAALPYMRAWCRYYEQNDHLKRLDAQDFVELFRQMYEVIMGKDCPPGLLKKSPKDEYLEEKGHQLGSLQNYNEVLHELAGKPVLVAYEITTDKYKSLRCYSGQVCGTGDAAIKDIRIYFTDEKVSCTYRLYLQGQGWTEPRKSGEEAEAPGRHVYGLSVALAPEWEKIYDLSFRLHNREGWSPMLPGGASAAQEVSPLDAIQLMLKIKAAT